MPPALLTASLALFTLIAGCAHVSKTAGPSDPLRGARHFVLESFDFSGCHVGHQTEAEYLADKSDLQRQRWEADKAEIARLYLAALARRASQRGLDIVPAPAPGPGYLILRPVITFIEPGKFTRSRNSNTQMQMKLVIADGQGGQVGHVPLAAHTLSSSGNPSISDRLYQTGSRLGAATARYLFRRTGAAR
jgi:hypothetical protein